jgi:subtilisin family serine protease
MTTTGREYSAGTVEHNATENTLFADGKKSGHGTIAWLPAPAYAMAAHPGWAPRSPHPVIALLDTGVRSHPWLSADEQSFVLQAEAYGWRSPIPKDDSVQTEDYHSHWGHATFIAGLIRLAAPDAQVLSMRVMNSQGKVSEDHVAEALNWLADNPELSGGLSVDIVLMAFGRQEDPGNKDLDKLRTPIGKLTGRGVRIVASAGNDGAEGPVYPAAFAAESKLLVDSKRPVLSVGAFTGPDTPTELALATERAPYSNYGPWVTEWRAGTNIISIMPLTAELGSVSAAATAPPHGHGYAWWSGTSFAAAAVAAELAAELPPVLAALPEPAAGS